MKLNGLLQQQRIKLFTLLLSLILFASCSTVRDDKLDDQISQLTETNANNTIIKATNTDTFQVNPVKTNTPTVVSPPIKELNIPKGEYILFEQDLKIKAFSTSTNGIFTLENLPFDPSVTDFIFAKNLNKVAYMSFFASDSIRFKDLITNINWNIGLEGYCQHISPRLGSWSPDGRFIIVFCEQVYIIDTTNGEKVQVSDLELPTRLINASWSPNGEKIFYVFMPDMQYGNDNGDVGFYLTDISILNNYNIIVGETKFWDVYSITFFYEWSADSSYIFYGNYPGIHAINIDEFGSRERLIQIDLGENLVFDEYYPELIVQASPFLNEIAFSYGRYLANYSISDETTQILESPIEHIIDRLCYPGDDENYCNYEETPRIEFYFDVGKKYQVTLKGNNLNLRNGPSLKSSILDQLDFGSIITFLEGPTYKENEVWWYVIDEKSGHKGWVTENRDWLENIIE